MKEIYPKVSDEDSKAIWRYKVHDFKKGICSKTYKIYDEHSMGLYVLDCAQKETAEEIAKTINHYSRTKQYVPVIDIDYIIPGIGTLTVDKFIERKEEFLKKLELVIETVNSFKLSYKKT